MRFRRAAQLDGRQCELGKVLEVWLAVKLGCAKVRSFKITSTSRNELGALRVGASLAGSSADDANEQVVAAYVAHATGEPHCRRASRLSAASS